MLFLNSFIQKIKDNKSIVLYLISFVLILVLSLFLIKKMIKTEDTKPKDNPIVTTSNPTVSSMVSVAPKQKPTDPDLVVKQKYVAKVNDKIIEVPLTNPKETLGTDNQTILTQTIDVTAAVKPIAPRWSIGTGVGRYHSETYIPLTIIRHYKPLKRSLSFSLKYSVDKGKITGGEIQHLWSF